MPVAGPGPAPPVVGRVDADHHPVAGRRPALTAQGFRLGRSQPDGADGEPARGIPPLVLSPQPPDRSTVLAAVPGGQPVRARCVDLVAAVRLSGRSVQPPALVAVHSGRRCPSRPALAARGCRAAGGGVPDLAAAHRAPGHSPAHTRRTGARQQDPHGIGPTGWRPGPDRRQGAAVPPQRRGVPDVRPSRPQPGGAV
ncbi:hypothetical protein D3C73_945910 [compost metagenome]